MCVGGVGDQGGIHARTATDDDDDDSPVRSLMGDPIALFSSNNPTEHVNMKHYPSFTEGWPSHPL